MFSLHPRLEADTAILDDWELCRVLLMNERTYPWIILVPRRDCIAEIGELDAADRARLIEEIAGASALLRRLARPDRLNVAALGNVVPQLHVHLIARFRTDPAWPGPVWGAGPVQRLDDAALADRLAAWRPAAIAARTQNNLL